VDPRLLMLVEADARRGLPGLAGPFGVAGAGGAGGAGGMGGPGGSGGSGGPAKYENVAHTRTVSGTDYNGNYTSRTETYYVNTCTISAGSSGSPGCRGPNGPAGSRGSRGRNGAAANDGAAASQGSVEFQVVGKGGKVVERASDRFNAAVLRFTCFDGNEDGIFEPGADGGGLQLRNVQVKNNGGLTLPTGAVVSVLQGGEPADDTTVPELAKGKTAELAARFHTDLSEVPCSIDRPYRANIRVGTGITLLGHAFDESLVSQEIPIQWPIEVTAMDATDFLAPNDEGYVACTITNASTRPYGCGAAESAGDVTIAFESDTFIHVLPDDQDAARAQEWGYEIGQVHKHTALATVRTIAPGRSVCVRFKVLMTSAAGRVLMDSLKWDVTLQLRNKPIEQRRNTIKVVPLFEPDIFCDVCLVTSPAMDRDEFVAWSYLLQLLNLSASFWDVQRYGGYGGMGRGPQCSTGEQVGWVGRCHVLIAPRLVQATSHSLRSFTLGDARNQLVPRSPAVQAAVPGAGGAATNAIEDRTAKAFGERERERIARERLKNTRLGVMRSERARAAINQCGPGIQLKTLRQATGRSGGENDAALRGSEAYLAYREVGMADGSWGATVTTSAGGSQTAVNGAICLM
jgi:hypothetical protein